MKIKPGKSLKDQRGHSMMKAQVWVDKDLYKRFLREIRKEGRDFSSAVREWMREYLGESE